MKKLLLIAALLFASYGAFADEFDEFVSLLRDNVTKQGWKMRADKAKRIIYIEGKLPCPSDGMTQEIFDELRPMLIGAFKQNLREENVPEFKKLNITIVFKIITTDRKFFTLKIAPRDL